MRAPGAPAGGANYALVPYAVTIAFAAVYFRDLGVLGPRQRRGLDVGGAGGAPPPAPAGVSISISPAGGVDGAAAPPPPTLPLAGLGSGGGGNGGGDAAAHSVTFAFCDS